jgi:ABC-2 type transport system permease protein
MRAIWSTFKTALLEAWTNRRSFWLQVSIMLANDLAWVIFWLLFFDRVGSLRGWDSERVLLLFAILTTIAGIALGLLGNSRRLGWLASEGELDAVLTLPVNPLAYLLIRRIDTAMLGDLFFGPVLFLLSGEPTLERATIYVVGSLCGAAVLVGFLVAAGSLTLFFGGKGEQADLSFQVVLSLASYPLDVFGGITKILLFTAVPAAFITGLPTRLVDDFDLATAGLLLAAALAFAALGERAFRLGLNRYSSGSAWTRP